MLASRGFAYTSGHAAERASNGKKYHGCCDCVPVPSWGAAGHRIEGYDLDALYGEYEAAGDAVGFDPRAIGAYVDAERWRQRIEVPAILGPGSADLPAGFEPLDPRLWEKTVRKHAADGKPVKGATRFEGWPDEQIAKAILQTAAMPDLIETGRGSANPTYYKVVGGVEVIVGTWADRDTIRITTAYPPGPERRRLLP